MPLSSTAPAFLALRYLRPKRTFVSVITIVSILGVALGVGSMVVVRSVMKGFEVDFRKVLIGAEPHALLSVDDSSGATRAPATEEEWRRVLAMARGQAETLSAAPVTTGVIYAEREGAQTAMPFFGLLPDESRAHLEKLRKHLIDGDLALAEGTIVLSDEKANDIGVRVGDEISIYASGNVNTMVKKFREAMDMRDEKKRKAAHKEIKLRPRKVRVSGVLRASSGGWYAYVPMKTGQELLGLGQGVSGVAAELRDPERAEEAKSKYTGSGALPAGWKVQLWTDAGEARLAAMQNEQIMMLLVLSVIALVAAFSVMNTTITVTTQKRREIGVLAALGSEERQITSIFVIQSAVVGVLGTLLGLAGSFLLLWLRDDVRGIIAALTGGRVQAIEGVFLANIPALVSPLDVAVTCVISLALCLLAGFIPAWFAARVEPAAALRD